MSLVGIDFSSISIWAPQWPAMVISAMVVKSPPSLRSWYAFQFIRVSVLFLRSNSESRGISASKSALGMGIDALKTCLTTCFVVLLRH